MGNGASTDGNVKRFSVQVRKAIEIAYLLSWAGFAFLLILPFSAPLNWVGAGAALFVPPIIGWVLTRHAQIEVGEEGIRHETILGRRVFLPWAMIRETKSVNILWRYRIALLSRKSALPMWLPLFLAQSAEFAATVDAFAPQNCPLRSLLKRDLGDRPGN